MPSDTCKRYDLVSFSEHHLPLSKLNTIHQACKAVKRKSCPTAAPLTKRSATGTSGGVFLAPLSHIALAPLSNSEMFHAGSDWAAIVLRLRGLDVLYIQLYLISGVGPKAENIMRLRTIFTYAISMGYYFILVGDWNMTPEELYSTGFIKKAKASIITVNHGLPTCRTGMCLDYVVGSCALAPALSDFHFVRLAPWIMHDVIGFSILRAPRSVQAKFLIRPTRFFESEKTSWQDSTSAFISNSYEAPLKGHGGIGNMSVPLSITPLAFIEEDAKSIGQEYASWSTNSERLMAIKTQHFCNNALGRGSAPRFVIRAIAKSSGAPDRKSANLTIWAAIERSLCIIIRFLKHGKDEPRYRTSIDFLVSVAAPQLYMIYMETEYFQRAGHLFLWWLRLNSIWHLPLDLISGLFVDAGKQREREQGQFRARVHRQICHWTQNAVTGHASAGHKFLKGSYQPPIEFTFCEKVKFTLSRRRF